MSYQSSNANLFHAAESEKGWMNVMFLKLSPSELYLGLLEKTVGLPVAVALSFSAI